MDQMELAEHVEPVPLAKLVSEDDVCVIVIVLLNTVDLTTVEMTAVNVFLDKAVSTISVQDHVLLNVLEQLTEVPRFADGTDVAETVEVALLDSVVRMESACVTPTVPTETVEMTAVEELVELASMVQFAEPVLLTHWSAPVTLHVSDVEMESALMTKPQQSSELSNSTKPSAHKIVVPLPESSLWPLDKRTNSITSLLISLISTLTSMIEKWPVNKLEQSNPTPRELSVFTMLI